MVFAASITCTTVKIREISVTAKNSTVKLQMNINILNNNSK